MSPAAPLEVLLLVVLAAAILARLHARVELALPLDELLDAELRFLLIHVQLLAGLLKRQDLLQVLVVFLVHLRDLLHQLVLPVLEVQLVMRVLLLDNFLIFVELLGIRSELVSLQDQP